MVSIQDISLFKAFIVFVISGSHGNENNLNLMIRQKCKNTDDFGARTHRCVAPGPAGCSGCM